MSSREHTKLHAMGNVFPQASLSGCGDNLWRPMLSGLEVVEYLSRVPKLGASCTFIPSQPPICTKKPSHPYINNEDYKN